MSNLYYKFPGFVINTILFELINYSAENPEDRAICDVDGKEYRDGEYFNVAEDPDLNCVCQPGYLGNKINK